MWKDENGNVYTEEDLFNIALRRMLFKRKCLWGKI